MSHLTLAQYLDQVESADKRTSAEDVTVDLTEFDEPHRSRSSTAVMFLMLITLAATYFTFLRNGPQQASAAFDHTDSTVTNRTVSSFLTSAPASVKWMEKTLASTEKVVQQFSAAPAVKQIPLAALKSNPFRGTSVIAAPGGPSAARRRMEDQRESALRAVEGLQLQSVLVNDKNRSCLINNGLYVEGQSVDQFVIERITTGSVIIRSGVYRFELKTR